jgi:hypothetical protein
MTSGDSRSARGARALLSLLLLLVAPDAAAWGIEQLMQELGKVKSASARFVERKHLAILTAPLESSGTLTYIAPDRLEKHTLAPRAESMVLERNQLTLESAEPKRRRTLRLDDHPVIGVFVESIRSTLAGDLALLRRLYEVALEGDERKWRLVLKPLDPKMAEVVSEIRIGGSRDWIGSIEFHEPGGDRSVMTITRDAR